MGKAAKASLLVAVLAVSAFSQSETAKVPVTVNVNATVSIQPPEGLAGAAGAQKTFTANTVDTLILTKEGGFVSVSHGAQRLSNVPAAVRTARGKISLDLNSQAFKNAQISLFAINGKQIMRGKASAGAGPASISRRNIAKGVYLLSVKGAGGGSFAARLTHGGGNLNISVAFVGGDASHGKQASAAGAWTISASAAGYSPVSFPFAPVEGVNPLQTIVLSQPTAPSSFTQTVTRDGAEVGIDMVYIPGGSFTLGCEAADTSLCPANTSPVAASVSSYFIGKGKVTQDQWWAVMGWYVGMQYNFQTGEVSQVKSTTRPSSSSRSTLVTNITWYDAFLFACELSKLTGKNYRMQTEAEFEYAAKKHLSSLDALGTTEEWSYNTWNATHSGGADPIGPGGSLHNQKTRRNAQEKKNDPVTGRLIRSIEGVGPALRLVLSADGGFPPNYVPSCEIIAPEVGGEPENSYRDMRWVTGGDAKWVSTSGMGFDFRFWDDGTATSTSSYGNYTNVTNGQWFTVNNIALVFVPNSGSILKHPYIFLDDAGASLLGGSYGYVGRIIKEDAAAVTKPAIANLKSGAQLAEEAGAACGCDDYKMVDMENISKSHKGKQDTRLIDGPDSGWAQINVGSEHHYRKDVDADEFRFTVGGSGSRGILANGDWFTVNNTFLRVTHPTTGYEVDYVYYVSSGGQFYHNSFMAYERGDMRVFTKRQNNTDAWSLCAPGCSDEIPKGQAQSMYGPGGYNANVGYSTFVPAPCPAGGCR